ncbi:hypothetical protein PG995_012247 [Apiospora arundinis]
MSTPQPQNELLKFDKELFGIQPRNHATWPPGGDPVFWIRYGDGGVYWNEVMAQDMAYHGLKRLGSIVRAPAVFYAFKHLHTVYLLMEYIAGDTAYERLEEAERQVEAAKWQADIALIDLADPQLADWSEQPCVAAIGP